MFSLWNFYISFVKFMHKYCIFFDGYLLLHHTARGYMNVQGWGLKTIWRLIHWYIWCQVWNDLKTEQSTGLSMWFVPLHSGEFRVARLLTWQYISPKASISLNKRKAAWPLWPGLRCHTASLCSILLVEVVRSLPKYKGKRCRPQLSMRGMSKILQPCFKTGRLL